MKIAYGLSDLGSCGYYRCVVPGLELRRRGHDVRFHIMAERRDGNPEEYLAPFKTRDPADIFIGQRIGSAVVARLMADFRLAGRVVITDTDDNLHEVPPSNPCSGIYGNDKLGTQIFESAMKLSTAISTSTKTLEERYACFGQTFTIENALDPEDFTAYDKPITGQPKRAGQVRIGWFGSATHRADLARIVKPLTRFMRAHAEVRFVLFGDDVRGMLPRDLIGRTEYHPPVSYSDVASSRDRVKATQQNVRRFYEALVSMDFDIGIAPLERTVFNNAKSFVKVLEYGLCGIPALASRVGPYQDYAERGGPILTANDEQWEARLEELLNADRRAEIARANREHIAQHHLIESRIDSYEAALAALLPSGALSAA